MFFSIALTDQFKVVKITNWSTCTHRLVTYSENFNDFKLNALNAFLNECDNPHVSLFKVKLDENEAVDERTRITAEVHDQLSQIYFIENNNMLIYFYNSLNSPQGAPEILIHNESKIKSTESMYEPSTSSSSSSRNSLIVKKRDEFTCQFCGHIDQDNMHAAHLLQPQDMDHIPTIEGKVAYLTKHGLGSVKDVANMITLCGSKCFVQFNECNIGFSEQGDWIVCENIWNEIIRGDQKYGDFNGKKICFRFIIKAIFSLQVEKFKKNAKCNGKEGDEAKCQLVSSSDIRAGEAVARLNKGKKGKRKKMEMNIEDHVP